MNEITPLLSAFVSQGRVPDCPIIDMHTHPDAFQGIYFPAPDMDGILRTMDRANVRQIAIAPHNALFDPAYGNSHTLRMLDAHPDRFLGYLCYNPHYPDDLAELIPLLDHPGVIGFKIHPSSANYPLTGDGYRALFEVANAREVIVLSHTWQCDTCGADQCRQIAERYPNIYFLLGHSCCPDWTGAIALAREFPRVYAELTYAAHNIGMIDRAVKEGIVNKLLFGTDLPWMDPFFTLGCIVFADITDEDRHAILHGNAERLLTNHQP